MLLRRFFNLLLYPKLYLLGGENIVKRSAVEVNERAFQEAKETASIAVFLLGKSVIRQEIHERYSPTTFVGLGAGSVDFVEYSDPNEVIAQKIASSSLSYLTDGYVNASWIAKEKDTLTRCFGITGRYRSAQRWRFGSLQKMPNPPATAAEKISELVEALGLAELALKAHYKPQKDPALALEGRENLRSPLTLSNSL